METYPGSSLDMVKGDIRALVLCRKCRQERHKPTTRSRLPTLLHGRPSAQPTDYESHKTERGNPKTTGRSKNLPSGADGVLCLMVPTRFRQRASAAANAAGIAFAFKHSERRRCTASVIDASDRFHHGTGTNTVPRRNGIPHAPFESFFCRSDQGAKPGPPSGHSGAPKLITH